MWAEKEENRTIGMNISPPVQAREGIEKVVREDQVTKGAGGKERRLFPINSMCRKKQLVAH